MCSKTLRGKRKKRACLLNGKTIGIPFCGIRLQNYSNRCDRSGTKLFGDTGEPAYGFRVFRGTKKKKKSV